MKRRLAFGLAIAMSLFALIVARAVWDGSAALEEGDMAASAGDSEEAIRQWRRAARWYAPGLPHVERAYERLEALAQAASQAGDSQTELHAWRGIRNSILATRWLLVPFADKLERANKSIAELMALAEDPRIEPTWTQQQRRDWHLERLGRSYLPAVGWTLLAFAGFAMWIGGAFGFAWRGVSSEDKLQPRAAAYCGLLFIVGAVVWLLGLSQA